MPGFVTSHRDLDVYQAAYSTGQRVFELTKSWPSEEKFALTTQIRNSSRSVCGNIAEAWRKRRYRKSLISKLNDAEAEAAETQVWLDHAASCGYISKELASELSAAYEKIMGMLFGMIQHADKWCIDPDK